MNAYICDYIRTPIGKYAGALANVRTDDLGAMPLIALKVRNPNVDWSALDEIVLGCANQAGEDNRNIARMSLLLAGFDVSVPGLTVNRLCASGMDAVATAARYIRSGEGNLLIAGGVESMSRAPFVTPKQSHAFSRVAEIHDTTIGWRFVNPLMKSRYGVDSMPETAENVARQFNIGRDEQDEFALASQAKYAAAAKSGHFADEITSVEVCLSSKESRIVCVDEHPRETSIESLQRLRTIFQQNGCSVTAGNSSGVNDGAAALLLSSERGLKQHSLQPKARIVASAAVGVEPRIMGMGPVPAVRKVLRLAGLSLHQMDVIELNEAFASQALACAKELGITPDDSRLNPNGGAIALGHPLGMSGARLIGTAVNQLTRSGGKYALCSMCVGVGQGVAIILERY